MKIVGIIPARYESSRFPGKPLAMICGRPMIYWVYHQAIKVRNFDEVYVATDNDLIQEECRKYGMNVIMTSADHQTGTDRMGEVAKKICADLYVNIQGDEPLIEPETIQAVIDCFTQDGSVEIINTKTKIKEADDVCSNTVVKVVTDVNNDGVYLSRSPIPYPKKEQRVDYYKHLGLYGITRKALLFFASSERTPVELIEDIEMLRFLENGYKIRFVTVESETIGVDRAEDILRVEKIMNMRSI